MGTMIAVGDVVPDVMVSRWGSDGPEPVYSREVLSAGTIVLFGVPGAFTRSCSDFHLPGFIVHASEIRNKGVDSIICVGVNDAYVMEAWATAQHADGQVAFLADGNGDLARAMGVDVDRRDVGLGTRNLRYVAILRSGVVQYFEVERGPGVKTTSAEATLSAL
jgi:peroxiredoxin